MKKTIFAAVMALAGAVIAADTKVGTIKFDSNFKITEASVVHQSLAGCATAAQGAKADTALQQADVTLASADNGGISVTIGSASQATSLGTAATTAATAYATSEQGSKADTAVQSVVVTTADNGGISVTVDGGTAVSTALGTAATTAASAYATAAQGTKADSALQQSDVAIATGSNGGISVKVGSAQAANSLGALATKSTVDASVIDVELGDYYLVEGESGAVDVMKRATE